MSWNPTDEKSFLESVAKWTIEKFGIEYNEPIFFQLESRVRLIMKYLKVANDDELMARLEGMSPVEMQSVCDIMVNNETFFFREDKFFEDFENVLLPYLANEFSETGIRIWSVGCSSGQEIYSLVMKLNEYEEKNGKLNVEINAFDISEKVLLKAKNGIYTKHEVERNMEESYLKKYFNLVGDNKYEMDKRIRERVTFNLHNLQEKINITSKAHLILCRNVLYYFSVKMREEIVKKILDCMHSDGIMVLSAVERLQVKDGSEEDYRKMFEHGCYACKKSRKTRPMNMQTYLKVG
jgi:chemotaxis protein methyltransferase CheR